MANITKIKAKDPKKPQEKPKEQSKPEVKKAEKKPAKQEVKEVKKTTKSKKKVFVLFRPFVAFGNYLKASWQEIRQVRWPNRKMTWKMFLAVVIYSAIFLVIITLLDWFFTFLFNLILA